MARRLAGLFPYGTKWLEKAFMEETSIIVDRTSGGSLGLRLADEDGTLVVRAVDDGLVKEWNKSNHKRRVREGDWLVEASGVKGSAKELVAACKQEKGLVLLFQRRGWYLRIYPYVFGTVMALALCYFLYWLSTRPRCPPAVVCEAGEECMPAAWKLRADFWQDLLADMNKTSLPLWSWFKHKANGGMNPVVLHIGPMDLSAPSDAKVYHLVKKFQPVGIFVEPNPTMVQALRKALPGYGFKEDHALVLQAAACTRNDPQVPLYGFTARFFQDNPQFEHVPFSMFSSLNQSYVEAAFMNVQPHFWSSYDEEQWAALGREYIDVTPTRCIDPATLLREARLRPSSVDAIIIDAEGLDVELAYMFVMMTDFLPAYIQFEWIDQFRGKTEWLTGLVQKLAGRGYTVYQDGSDLIAVLVKPLALESFADAADSDGPTEL